MVKHLVVGDKYQNYISRVIFTLNLNDDGLWFLTSRIGVGDPCNEEAMIKLLKSRFIKIEG